MAARDCFCSRDLAVLDIGRVKLALSTLEAYSTLYGIMRTGPDDDRRELLDEAAALIQQASPPVLGAASTPSRGGHFPAWAALAAGMGLGRPQVGDMPPEPPTRRGKIGAVLVKIVQRALFWYTAQIRADHKLISEAADEQLKAVRGLISEQQRLQRELVQLSERVSAELGQRDVAIRRLERVLRLPEQRPEVEDLALHHAGVFRGKRAEIKQRLSVYLPYARDAFAATARVPALDLGCGRGEWLELMREENIPVLGVDSSAEMIRVCSDRGLQVKCAEILSFLQRVPEATISVLTAFHVVEHLTFPELIELLDQVVRVLKPGGAAIFETPNPQNVFVGANTFHLDPTHTRPLPCQLLSYLAEVRGLHDVKTVFLNPYPESFRLPAESCEAVRFINEVFYGPQDYAIIAKRMM